MVEKEIKTPDEVRAEAEIAQAAKDTAAAAADAKAVEDAAAAAAAAAPPPDALPTPPPTAAEDMISKANAATARQEAANVETARLIEEQKAIAVEKTLGGTADAGGAEQTDEEKSIAQAKEFIKGTGFEDEIFPETKRK